MKKKLHIPPGYRSKQLEDRRREAPMYAMDKREAYEKSVMLDEHFDKMDAKARKNVGPRTREVAKVLRKRRKY